MARGPVTKPGAAPRAARCLTRAHTMEAVINAVVVLTMLLHKRCENNRWVQPGHGDGSVLDSTLAFWGTEPGSTYMHDIESSPRVRAGAAAARLKAGAPARRRLSAPRL